MKLIDGDPLMNTLCELRDNAIKWLADCRERRSAMTPMAEQAVLTFNECISQVKKSSEVDAVPVVRCRDCIWYEIAQLKKDGTEDRRYKPSYCSFWDKYFEPDWFCAEGERREDEG